jgi:hypothetical protein
MLAVVAAGNRNVHKRMMDRMHASCTQKRARVDEVLNGGSDSEDAIQSITHHADADASWGHESSYEYDSDDCGL